MTREVKFRGKRKDNGEWVYGFLLVTQMSGAYIIGTKTKSKPHKIGGEIASVSIRDVVWQYEVEPATVGQYTGLHDKNSKEIYEGDVIKHHDDILSEVFYNSLMCAYLLKDITGNRNKCQVDRLGEYSSLWIEVVGNIHEQEATP